MSRTVCFIDKIGLPGTCAKEAMGKVIDCKKCDFYKKFKGKEGIYLLLLERRAKNLTRNIYIVQ